MDKEAQSKRKKRLWPVIGIVSAILVAVILWLCLSRGGLVSPSPTLKIESPQKRAFGDSAPFTVDVTLSALGEALYPAASLSVDFDRSRLEFLGVEEGNLPVTDGASGEMLPAWSVDPEQCNKSGIIRIMYLDMTGGKYAFSEKLVDGTDNVVLRLSFRLRGSARRGDVYELNVADAVFAANEEAESLASIRGTLKTVNGRIAVEK